MMQKSRMQQIMRRAIDQYGERNQTIKAIEECNELGCVLARSLTSPQRVSKEEIVTEIADVWIMVNQLSAMYSPCEINDEIERKLNRLEQRLDNESRTED